MFHFLQAPLRFQQIGLVLLALQLSLFVFGMPLFQFGIWVQTEPEMVALFALAALNAAWLAIGVARGWLAGQPSNILWRVLLLWVGWQLIATAFAASPWRSWFGPPETGEGAGWHVAMLLLVMVIYPLWQIAAYRRVIFLVAFANLAAMCILHWQNPDEIHNELGINSWRPAKWADYLVFIIGYVWIALLGLKRERDAGRFCLLIIATFLVLYFSQSKSAILLCGAAVVASVFVINLRLPGFFAASGFWRNLAVVLCLLPLLWIPLGQWLAAQRYDSSDVMLLLTNKNESMGQRIAFSEVATQAMTHEPLRWLAGAGWGRFTDDVFKYALLPGVHVFFHGEPRPNWGLVNGSAFHSHSQPLETLLSLGLPGLVLWFAIIIVTLKTIPAEYFWRVAPMLVALVLFSYLWFELPQCMPYRALALAALCAAMEPGRRERAIPQWMVALLLWGCAVFGWSAWQQVQAQRYGEELYVIPRSEKPDHYSAEWLARDARRGGDRFGISAVNFAGWAMRNGAHDADTHGWYGDYMLAAQQVATTPHMGPRNASAELTLYYQALSAFDDPLYDDLRHKATESLEDAVLRFTSLAPLREDFTQPFLSNLAAFTHEDVDAQVKILQAILAIAPDHRSALWLLGKIYITDDQTRAQGEAMLKRAVALEVERVYPLSDAEIAPYK